MKTTYRKEYWPIESYKEVIDILDKVTSIILFSFAEHSVEVKDVIIRNFIARAIVTLKGILRLLEISDHQDCWVLYRCVLDRLFHLRALAEKNEFELFEKWSFKQQYELRDKLWSDPDFKEKINPKFFKDKKKEKKRYVIISKEQPRWNRPKTKVVAKNMNLEFLYKYGYDYASTLVHPMANDGQDDFLRQTNIERKELFIDQKGVINNSILVVILLIQEGLNSSNFVWRRLLYDFLDDVFSFLKTGSKDYLSSFVKICKLGPDIDLCKIRDK